jgi:hypothetical protein
VAGGVALMAFGAGLLMAHPAIRRTVMATLAPLMPDLAEPLKIGAQKVLPDVERYLKLKAM